MRTGWTRAAGVLALASAALAGDPQPARHDLAIAERWEAGETTTQSIVVDMRIGYDAPDDEFDREERTTVKAELVRKCLEVGPGGELRRALVHVAGWSRTQQEAGDTSLAGALLETGPHGWTLLASAQPLSQAAILFLDENVGANALPLAARLTTGFSRKDAAVGDTWAPEDAAMASLLAQRPAVRLADLGMRMRLESYDPASGAVRIGVSARGAPVGKRTHASGSTIDLQEGSVITADGAISGTSMRWQRDGSFVFRMDSKILSKVRAGTLRATCAMDFSIASRAGGEVPAPPEERPGSVRFARSAAWKRGDAVTEVGTLTYASSARDVAADGEAGPAKGDVVTLSWTSIRRCTESASGEPLAFEVFLRAWKRVESGATDECLAGAIVDVAPGGWKVRDGRRITSGARNWLTGEFGSAAAAGGDEGLRALVTPHALVAAGDGWEPDPAAMAAIARNWIGLPVDRDGATATATLERSDAGGAAISWCVDAPIQCVAGCGCTNAEVLKGGRVKVSGTSSGDPAEWTRKGETSDRLEASVSLPAPNDGAKRVSIVQTRTRKRSLGGDFPAE